ncbi:MAG: o-succinylbenzoate synthase [Pseudomonadota bacterium]
MSGLSPDYSENFATIVDNYCQSLSNKNLHSSTINKYIPAHLPSLRFAFEMALLDLQRGGRQDYFDLTNTTIPINGLIWMGDLDFMQQQIEAKLYAGYQCLKIKVGSLEFEKEYQLVRLIRNKYSAKKLIIRLDANGAYAINQAQNILEKWSELNIHSIEQPIRAGQITAMAKLCSSSPIKIALDEELIGIIDKQQQEDLLSAIQPAYIILKPTLLGGFNSTLQWIKLAQSLDINWWLTSALESNIALNAITQYTAQFQPVLHQGLGTGALYENNFPTTMQIKNGFVQL